MVWVKDKIGNGFYVRGKHELLFIGEKGDMPVPEEKNRPASVIEAPRKEHSRKPDIVYEIIEKMYPNRKYLELFPGSQFNSKWTIWGIGEQQTVNISPISDENH
jgi:N6-adenosine-specific RNA methylase IME4